MVKTITDRKKKSSHPSLRWGRHNYRFLISRLKCKYLPAALARKGIAERRGRKKERAGGADGERTEKTGVRNAGINSHHQGERNEINTSISAVIAAGVNKGLIEPEFAFELAMFRVSRSKESDLYAVVTASLFSLRTVAPRRPPCSPRRIYDRRKMQEAGVEFLIRRVI